MQHFDFIPCLFSDLPGGADVVNMSMTVADAQKLCGSLKECMGFTFLNDKATLKASLKTPVHIYLKASDEWVPNKSHVTYLKILPHCRDLSLRRYRLAGFGPYCCEGSGCPAENVFGTLELTCTLPFAAPFGLPNCDSLQGDPLKNLALEASASASSEWRHDENSGLDAVKVNLSLPHAFYFRSAS